MAVTKIRKISSWTLLLTSIASIVVLGLFYSGGVVDPAAEMKEPVNTDMLINLTYGIFGLTIGSTVIFALMQFGGELISDIKGALMSIGSLVALAVVFVIAYSFGDGTPIQGMNAEAQVYNTESWLRITDMWIYTTYIMIALILIVVVFGSVKKILGK